MSEDEDNNKEATALLYFDEESVGDSGAKRPNGRARNRRQRRRRLKCSLAALQLACAFIIVSAYGWLFLRSAHMPSCGKQLSEDDSQLGTSWATKWWTNNNGQLCEFSPVPGWYRTALDGSGDGASLNPDPRYQVVADRAAVACDVPVCSEMGTTILRKGGSAVDAALTVALCIGSVNSHSSGLGGGGFMTVRHSNGSSLAFNFREMAPAAAFKHMYDQAPLASQFGGLAAGVPGELAGLEEAFKRYTSGKLSWAELFAPVIALNRNGFTVGKALGRAIELAAPALTVNPSQWKWLYVLDGDKEYGQQWRLAREGDVIRRKNLSKTLELIARNGSSAIFYDPNGSIVHNLVNTVQRMGGIMTPEDFANYSVVVSEPLRVEFMGREVLTTPNPSSGPALVMALKTMQYLYEDDDSYFQDDFDPVATQRLVEVMKWMAAARTELGDSAENLNPKIESIMSDEWAYNVSRHVSDSHTLTNWTEYDPSYEPAESHGTAHFSIIDEDGMAVSMTTTVNLYFGAMIADPVTGIVINSEMDDFSLPSRDNAYDLRPSVYNYVGPRKRPLSSTVPTIVSYENEVELVIGAAGGSRIVTAVLQAIVRTYIYGESMLRTIARPRLHHQLLPETAFLEFETPSDVVYELESRGHNVTLMNPVTAMNGILRDETGTIYAVADFWRKGGLAAGY